MFLTGCISADGGRSVARRGEVSSGCAGQVERSFAQHCSTRSGHDDTVTVRPLVAWLRVTIRHAGQYVPCRVISICWSDGHIFWTVYTPNASFVIYMAILTITIAVNVTIISK